MIVSRMSRIILERQQMACRMRLKRRVRPCFAETHEFRRTQ